MQATVSRIKNNHTKSVYSMTHWVLTPAAIFENFLVQRLKRLHKTQIFEKKFVP